MSGVRWSAVLGIGLWLAGSAMLATQSTPRSEGDLASVFTRGLFLEDENGDGVIDAIAARIVLPTGATPDDIVAAANIAARLGFETSAFTPGLAVTDTVAGASAGGSALILVGRENALVQRLVREERLRLDDLEPGQGKVALLRDALDRRTVLVVAGADPAGTRAAGAAVSARLPFLWQLRAESIDSVKDDLRSYLEQHDVAVRRTSALEIVYEQEKERTARLVLDLDVGPVSDRALAVLEEVARAHVVGEAVFVGRLADTLNYHGLDVLRVRSGARSVDIPRFGPPYSASARSESWASNLPPNPWKPAVKQWGLSAIFTTGGLLGDSRGDDKIADETETTIIVGSGATSAIAAVDLAARIGVESTGVTLPLARVESEIREIADVPNPILMGPGVLAASLGADTNLGTGEGVVRIVPAAFGPFPAVLVSGGDVAGLNAAAMYLARSIPYVWTPRRGEDSLSDVEDELRAFFRARTSAGQAAAAVDALQEIVDGLVADSVESMDVRIYLEEESAELPFVAEKVIRQRLGQTPLTVSADSRYGPVLIFQDSPDLGWEVDELRRRFTAEVLPAVRPGQDVQVEALVSESPEIRAALEAEFRAALEKAGATDPRVRVISAYKQGYSWLADYVAPKVKGKPVGTVTVFVPVAHPARSGEAWYGLPIRWLQEIFPIDWILARELGIDPDDTTFVKRDEGAVVYRVEVKDRDGRTILKDEFAPRYIEKEYFPYKPTAKYHYTTGGMRVIAEGKVVADFNVKTDPERFWDYYQTQALPRMFEYAREYTRNRLGLEHQPFFRDLIFDIRMSEPDFRLDLDEERISSLDSLHEDLMFNTIDFWGMFTGNEPGSRRVAPGRIMPMIHPVTPGRAPEVTISFSGNAVPTPRLVVEWRTRSGGSETRTVEFPELQADPPRVVAVTVRAGEEHVADLTAVVQARTLAEARRAARLVERFEGLQKAGAFREALTRSRLESLTLRAESGRAVLSHSLTGGDRKAAAQRRQFPVVQPDPATPIVTWDHVIAPAEFEDEILPRLRSFPEINPYIAGRSYRGRNVWAMDVKLPIRSEVWSQAKATALKPVLLITTRQHANEVSATSAGLRLVELLARDPDYREYLKRMHIVYHPFENPDGAANHYEFHKLQPTYILHAGYWSSVARDVGAYIWDDDPLLPEALVRRKLYYTWLPDIYMNPHGYPTHEWVHQFAGYQNPWFMAFWIPRGYHINLHHLDDPNYPGHKSVGLELRERIIEEVQGVPEIRAANERLIRRFEKYARRYEPDPFRLEVYKGMNILFNHSYSFRTGGPFDRDIYVNALGRRPNLQGRGFLERYPQITVLDLGSDMPDETASPEWMEKIAARGQFGYLMANVKLLNESSWEVRRFEEDFGREVRLSVFRPRPVAPGGGPVLTTGR